MLLPERRIDPVVGIERRDDDKADAAVAFGVTRFAREFDTNLPKLCRKGCIQDRFGMCVLHVGIALSVYGLRQLRWPTIISALPRLQRPRLESNIVLPAFAASWNWNSMQARRAVVDLPQQRHTGLRLL